MSQRKGDESKVRPSASQPEKDLLQATDSLQLRATQWKALAEASKILNSTLHLDSLLELILEVATHELRAERGTVFLLDKQAGELRARISQGLESRLLHIKVGQGVAGKAVETGESIRIQDAYQDPRFFPDIDAVSGYRTRSLLCTPIRNKRGEIIGAIELLNKIQGNFDREDEIFLQALTVHIAIALENAHLHAKLVDQERIRTELELARQIQQNLLRPPPERWQNYRLAAKADPCYEVGGDFYDFFALSDTAMWVVIADVSGKGVSSALVMSTVQATLHALVVGVHSFERLLWQLNGMIRDFTGGTKYLTLFLALLDSENRRLHYINAGHNPPVLAHSDGRFKLLEEGGTVLGLLPHVRFARAQTTLEPGDVLVLYTDGIVEASNRSDEMFGVEGLLRSIEATRQGGSPEEILTRVLSDVREFSAGEPPEDDQSLIVISADH